MKLFKLFSLRSQPVFALLVAGLGLFSVLAWWSVKASIEADIRSRLESELDRIEAQFRDRLTTYANSLIHVRGHFQISGVPNEEAFQRFMGTLQVSERYPGVRAIGYISVVSAGNSLSTVSREPNGFATEIRLLEPHHSGNKGILGRDMMEEPRRRSAIHSAASTGEPTLTEPVRLLTDGPGDERDGFLLFLPVYADVGEGQGRRDPLGFVFAAFRATDFFEGAFGTPSADRETVTFSLQHLGESKALAYSRFPTHKTGAREITRDLRLFGRDLRLSVKPLPHFFSFSDRYLPTAVAAGACFISILILLVLKSSQNQLLFETRAKEANRDAANRSRAQTELLERLNEYARLIASDLDLDGVVKRTFDLVPRLAKAQAAALYFVNGRGESSAELVHENGVEPHRLFKRHLAPAELAGCMPGYLCVRKSALGACESVSRLIDATGYADWLVFGIPAREMDRCGLLFLARENAPAFDEMEVEIVTSLVSQAAAAIENARLYRNMEDAGRAKSAFLANMSHEIRTPLNAVVGFSEILLTRKLGDEQKAGLAKGIRKSGQQLTRIIDDLLDLSKIEAGKVSIERRRVNLASILQDVKAVMELRAREKRIRFRVEALGPIPTQIVTDEIRLKQVLMNLLGNAIKFTERGSVHLQVHTLPARSGSSESLAFRIKDTGVGIPLPMQTELFQPFSQVDESSTRRFGGSGLGLALSRRLCQEMGGDIQLLESQPGQGSTFEARIEVGELAGAVWTENPFEVGEAKDPTEKPLKTVRLDGTRVLLVEDSEDNQEIFRFFLESAGANVAIVDNGLEAVRRAAVDSFDLILMDIQIPEIDGKEATRRIRKQGFQRPILALTAHAMVEERESCLRAGCDDQITKPVSGDDLIVEVAAHVRRTHGPASQYP